LNQIQITAKFTEREFTQLNISEIHKIYKCAEKHTKRNTTI